MDYYLVRDGPAGADSPGEGEGGGQDEDVGAVQRGGEEQVYRQNQPSNWKVHIKIIGG